MDRNELQTKLQGGLFLSAMLNLTDAAWCVEYGAGAKMLQLGTMIVAPVTEEYAGWRQRWPKTWLPDDPAGMREVLAKEVETVHKGLPEALVCLSIAGFQIEHVVAAARAFDEAGGDLVELNAHGGVRPWSEQGYLVGMARPEYRPRLVSWAEQLAPLDVPLLIKFNTRVENDFVQILRDLAHVPVWGYHYNIRDDANKQPRYGFVEQIRSQVQGPLLVSGYAWDAERVRRLRQLGADAIGFSEPVMNDPGFINRMAQELTAR